MSAGRRAIWFDKNNPEVVFLDIRPEMNPTCVADSRNLPASIGASFDLVVFDPPHVNFSASAALSRQYGHHATQEIRTLIAASGKEAHRVTRAEALMAFKWNDHDQKLEKVLALLSPGWEPLFGYKVAMRTKHASSTTWTLLKRRAEREEGTGS